MFSLAWRFVWTILRGNIKSMEVAILKRFSVLFSNNELDLYVINLTHINHFSAWTIHWFRLIIWNGEINVNKEMVTDLKLFNRWASKSNSIIVWYTKIHASISGKLKNLFGQYIAQNWSKYNMVTSLKHFQTNFSLILVILK